MGSDGRGRGSGFQEAQVPSPLLPIPLRVAAEQSRGRGLEKGPQSLEMWIYSLPTKLTCHAAFLGPSSPPTRPGKVTGTEQNVHLRQKLPAACS